MADEKFWVALSRVPSLGPARFRLLEAHLGSLEAVWRASPADLQATGLDGRALSALLQMRPRLDPDEEMARLERAGVRAITWHNPDYPPLLKEIPDPPPVLFVKGRLLPDDRRAIAVVGTRRATAYGRQACEALVEALSRQGITIVSGLARGIDAVAHRAALRAGGRTIAVMASGLDTVYPAEHRGLAREIEGQGALLSEHPLGVRPEARHFPRRNRILSGLSLGVLVVEAPEDSGAMWTVQWAAEQGREVFAVPGSIFSPASRGTNRLIQDGAKLVLEVQDILEEFNLSGALALQPPLPQAEPVPASETEARILGLLSAAEPVHADEIGRQAGLPIAVVTSTLTLMELRGVVKHLGGMFYVKSPGSGGV